MHNELYPIACVVDDQSLAVQIKQAINRKVTSTSCHYHIVILDLRENIREIIPNPATLHR